jgi:L-alanine-DL-glutamate epimerase-like enolase superfamily enzyme
VDLKADVQNVRALRERLGDDVSLRVDANAGMGFDAALVLLRKLAPYGIDAAGQLLPIWDLDGMAELARRCDIPLLADECVATDHDLIEVIRKRAREGPFTVGIGALSEDVVADPGQLEGNQLRVPDAPGLGFTLDEDRIKKLRVDIRQ